MQFREYQEAALKTAIYPGQGDNIGFLYVALGVAGEAGEIANKVKKLLRDGVTLEAQDAIRAEIGDVLWYLAALSTELGTALEDIAEENLDKLNRRMDSGTLRGSGDERGLPTEPSEPQTVER